MDDAWVRLLVVAGLIVTVAGVTFVSRPWQRPGHPRLDLGGRDLGAGVIVFTSTDCATCKDVLAVLRPLDVPLREVTWELEGRLLEELGVASVPLTVFVGPENHVVDQFVGVPRRRRLARAEAAWRRATLA